MQTAIQQTNNIVTLSQSQKDYIQSGKQHRARLRQAIHLAVQKTSKRNFYIQSPPGLGKSFTVKDEFRKANIYVIDETNNTPPKGADICYPLEGNTSLWAFTLDLAIIVANRDPKKHIYLFMDDCDNLLGNKDSVNTLKIALEQNKLNYNKSLSAQYHQLNELEQAAIDHFRVEGRNGITIPLENMTIIWCSNYKLADAQDIAKVQKGTTKWQKFIDEEALRRRLNARDYDVNNMVKWGWVADCILNETPPTMKNATKEQLEQIVTWMQLKWNMLKEQNITLAEKLYEEMCTHPSDYISFWEYDYTIMDKS